MWTAIEYRGKGRTEVACATRGDALQWVEDRAVELWSRLLDPNAEGPGPAYPGLWFYCEYGRIVSRINSDGFETMWIVEER